MVNPVEEFLSENKTYHPQHLWGPIQPKTLTVGELMEALESLPPDLPVIYKMPRSGVFGSGRINAIGGVSLEALKGYRVWSMGTGAGADPGSENGLYVDVPAWEGVILS